MIRQVLYAVRVITHPRSRWRLWEWGRRPVMWALIAEPLVLAWAVIESVDAFGIGIDWTAWVRFGLVGTAAVAYVVSTNVAEERRRGRDGDKTHIDHTSLVFFAGALVLPVPLAILLIVLVRFHRWWIARKPVYTFVHTSFAICCSVLGVHAVARLTPLGNSIGSHRVALGAPLALSLLGGVAAYYTAQTVMVGAARGLASPVWDQVPADREDGWQRRLRIHMVGDRSDNTEIVVTLLVAAMITWAAIAWSPLLLLITPIGAYLTVRGQQLEQQQQEIEALTHTAEIDSRTGLLMVDAFQRETTKVLARAAHDGSPMSLVLLDLDHFKRVNDTFGHLVGDDVLAAVGALLREESRPGDLVCRWGGEEMVMALPNTDHEAAMGVAERIRAAVEALTIPITKAAGGDLWVMGLPDEDGVRRPDEIRTVSIGVATIPQHGSDFDEAFKLADRALYVAKAGGRNRVCTAETDQSPKADQSIT
ncbi:GGDEF domain-containing protein [Amycolatopsis vastitatis]|uniref:GGDEF domain-containing protein n=1 Tax=Amycolatopsis vastitatis TaxID=1905142 RepID=UPI001304171C|nr:GGDEF domain-containing protein [Amycolatopsis vastitatis]